MEYLSCDITYTPNIDDIIHVLHKINDNTYIWYEEKIIFVTSIGNSFNNLFNNKIFRVYKSYNNITNKISYYCFINDKFLYDKDSKSLKTYILKNNDLKNDTDINDTNISFLCN